LAATQKVGKKTTAVVKWLKLSPYTPIEVTHYRLKRKAPTLYSYYYPQIFMWEQKLKKGIKNLQRNLGFSTNNFQTIKKA
jgi:hypothetical protein